MRWLANTFTCLCALLSAPLAAEEHPHDSPVPLYPEFTELFERRLAEEKVPGAVFAVVRGNQVEHIHSYGVRAKSSNEPVTADTVFRIASVSKTFAAGLAARLQHDGLFNWNDPLTQYVPEFAFANPEMSAQVEVQHLLAHSVGIVPNAYDNLIEANYSSEQIIPYFQRLNPLCEPGQCYGYQNVLFNLIENVLSSATGRSYQQLLRDYIFQPLNMQHSSVGIDGYLASENRAAPHVKGRNRWYEREVTEHYYHFPAAAGVNTTARDLSHWVIAQLGHKPQVMPEPVLDDVRQPRIRTTRDLRRRNWRRLLTNAHYGLGWRLYDLGQHSIVYHGGWVKGFRAEIAYSPEQDIGLLILMNAESNVISELSTAFWADILPRLQREQWIPYYHGIRSRSKTPKVQQEEPWLLPLYRGNGSLEIGEGLLKR